MNMKMIIGGKQADSVSSEKFDIINPATGNVIDSVPKCTAEDIRLAVDIAHSAQKVWADIPVFKRAEYLYKFLDIVEENKESLAQTLMQENGKPIAEARAEIGNIHIGFSGFIEHAKHYYEAIIPPGLEAGQQNNLVMVQRAPVGVVACIIPFNFPCDLFVQKVAPALMMGNVAIVLPSSDNPLTLMRLTGMLLEAGLPAGVAQCLTAPGSVKGEVAKNKKIGLITFTGSTAVGIETAKTAAQNLIPCALELGGNDAFIVLDDADLNLAADEVVWGRLYNAGQVCCASKRFIVHNSVKSAFVEKVTARVSQKRSGAPHEEDTEIACLISENAAKKVEAQVERIVEQGGTLVRGGKRNGAFYEPTIITDIPASADVAKDEEIFGPVVSIIGFDTDEEAIEIANNSVFGLSSCVFSENFKRAYAVASKMEAGNAVINGASFFRSFEMPFGGWKMSGIGTEGVYSTFEEMTNTRNVVLKNLV
jgi:succinate-semialdehyde dehydrogenase/glutarate-semialdehyde dehydrogenase